MQYYLANKMYVTCISIDLEGDFLMVNLGEKIKRQGNWYDSILWKTNNDKSIEILTVDIIVLGDVW